MFALLKSVLLLCIMFALIHGMFIGTIPVGFNMATGTLYYINVEVENTP